MHKLLECIAGPMWAGTGEVFDGVIRIEDGLISSVEPRGNQELPAHAYVVERGLILPGLHDAHLHLCMGGLMLGHADFSGVTSADEFSDRLADYVKHTSHQPGEWILGRGVNEAYIQVTREAIDKVCPDSPVFIETHDLHSAIVNSKALVLAGIQSNTTPPDGGKFEKNDKGVLTGVLRETAAFLVNDLIPPPTPEEGAAAIARAQGLAFSLGITAASASVRGELLPCYEAFRNSQAHKIRMNAWQVSPEFDFDSDRFEWIEEARFRFRTLKGFADGALGSRSAAFWQPYADDKTNAGLAQVREGPLARYVRAAHKEGYQVAIHAIGDRANSICLDAYEMAGSGGLGPGLRPRIEHCQVLRERDVARFAKLGVVASMQPIHCTADRPFIEQRIGSERCRYAYAWNSLKQAGAVLAFGSDWPVESLNPWQGLQAAVTRDGWQTQECLEIGEALEAYTMGAAYAAHWDEKLGTIEAGKFADLTIASENVFEIAPEKLGEVKAKATVVGGEVVFEEKDEGR